MTREEYVTTFTINGKRADVGIDDYGQCYFLEWEENGEKKEAGLGTYNAEFIDDVFFLLDPVYRHLWTRVWTFSELTDSEAELYNAYQRMIEEIYKDMN